MAPQALPRLEQVRAARVAALEGPLARVGGSVVLQVGFPLEGLPAHLAGEGPQVRMGCLMKGQLLPLLELLSTGVAPIRVLVRVIEHVQGELALQFVGFPAGVALERLFVAMD